MNAEVVAAFAVHIMTNTAALIHGPSRWPEKFRLQVTLDDDIGNL